MPIHGEPTVTACWQRQEQPLEVRLHTTNIPIVAAHAVGRVTPHEIPYYSLMAGDGPARQYALLTHPRISAGLSMPEHALLVLRHQLRMTQ